MASSFLCLLFISLSTADGFKMYTVDRCNFNSTELKDIQYVLSYYYNKIEVNRFDSDVGKFVGYTEFGEGNAEIMNSGAYLTQMKAEKEMYCHYNIGIWNSNILSKSGECAGLCDIIRC
ncbi:HLA class II histocompatibility antigen, DRB1 beta chain-like [Simochromis diagramma]|uniref:HLA class II histocompatibility antigen, DRB1 beta chain-like n=1 Tax=Simochromis diagramma TaxID=43689 RepID=UPI001A7E9845|nr:HLA class II histocompatibility antigen, DRB1 beta chain-like [Simochromis diagramma]